MTLSSVPSPRGSTPYPLRLRRDSRGPSVVVSVIGELDMLTSPALDVQLHAAETEVTLPGWVVLDLTGVSFLGCAGLTVLLACHQRFVHRRSAMRLVVGSNVRVLRILRLSGLDTILNVFDTLEQAMAPAVGHAAAVPLASVVAVEQVRSTPSRASLPLSAVTAVITQSRTTS